MELHRIKLQCTWMELCGMELCGMELDRPSYVHVSTSIDIVRGTIIILYDTG